MGKNKKGLLIGLLASALLYMAGTSMMQNSGTAPIIPGDLVVKKALAHEGEDIQVTKVDVGAKPQINNGLSKYYGRDLEDFIGIVLKEYNLTEDLKAGNFSKNLRSSYESEFGKPRLTISDI